MAARSRYDRNSRRCGTATTRREFNRTLGLGLTAGMLGIAPVRQAGAIQPKRPNIIFFLTDDQRWDALGCMGNPVLKTPNIDALARQGALFTRACVTTSICCASRASILTGQYTSRHGITNFNTLFTPEALALTYPSILRREGYHVGFIGKYGVGNALPRDAFDFSRATPQLGPPWQKDGTGRRIHTTRLSAEQAAEFLQQRPQDRPFCLSLSFHAPHAADDDPKQYLFDDVDADLYEKNVIPVPKTAAPESLKTLPPFFDEQNFGRVRWHWRFDTPARYQQYMKAYYRLITEIDRAIGDIVAELRRLGLDDNTVILFAGDNGYFYGEHGLADKWYPYQESIRVPLVVYDPRLPASRRGRRIDDFALNVDIAPTILSLAGCGTPPGMQGADLSPLCAGSRPSGWRTDFFYEHPVWDRKTIPASQALVTKEMKYILWPEYGYEELFDLVRDPLEERNVVGERAYAGTLVRMRARFEKLRAAAK